MIAFNSLIILIAAYVCIFLQSAMNGLLGVQLDILPALMVYASLTAGPLTIAVLAFCGGLWFDSLSANPLGITILPLLAIGFVIQLRRDLILRDQTFAQFIIGMTASALMPLIILLFLLTAGKLPVLGWGTVWQIIVLALFGGAMTPAFFWLFGRVAHTFDYREATTPSFRSDREIRRGRN